MSIHEPVVAVATMTRWYIECEVCNTVPMFFGDGFPTEAGAKEAARTHRRAHAEQPFCTCGTYPNLTWDDDEDDLEDGHAHCRHQGRCCECGCLTKTPEPSDDVNQEAS